MATGAPASTTQCLSATGVQTDNPCMCIDTCRRVNPDCSISSQRDAESRPLLLCGNQNTQISYPQEKKRRNRRNAKVSRTCRENYPAAFSPCSLNSQPSPGKRAAKWGFEAQLFIPNTPQMSYHMLFPHYALKTFRLWNTSANRAAENPYFFALFTS